METNPWIDEALYWEPRVIIFRPYERPKLDLDKLRITITKLLVAGIDL